MQGRNFFQPPHYRSRGFLISNDKTGMDSAAIASYLETSVQKVELMMASSVCFAAFYQGRQVAFANFAPTERGYDLNVLFVNSRFMSSVELVDFLSGIKNDPIFFAKSITTSCDNIDAKMVLQSNQGVYRHPTAAYLEGGMPSMRAKL